jgi:hypothetical protein
MWKGLILDPGDIFMWPQFNEKVYVILIVAVEELALQFYICSVLTSDLSTETRCPDRFLWFEPAQENAGKLPEDIPQSLPSRSFPIHPS